MGGRQWLDCFDRVAREFAVARLATRLLRAALVRDPSLSHLDKEWSAADCVVWKTGLEATDVVRLFAVFEQSLRDDWFAVLRRVTEPPVKQLVDAIGPRLQVPDDWSKLVHDIRVYRNAWIHDSQTPSLAIPFHDCHRRLRRLIGRFPHRW